jgi:hypothetical protein
LYGPCDGAQVCFAEAEELAELLGILKRMCCNTEYMFLYTVALLAQVDVRLGEEIVDEEFRRTAVGGAEGGDTDLADRGESALLVRRRKLRRIRQELEDAAVWQKRDASSGALTNEARFALKLLGTYTKAPGEAQAEGVLKAELLDMVRGNQATSAHVQRILGCYFGDAAGDPDGWVPTDAVLAQLGPTVHYLRSPVVLDLLVRALVHPTKKLPHNMSRRTAKLLALACGSGYEEVDEDPSRFAEDAGEAINSIVALEHALVEARQICDELTGITAGLTSYDPPKRLLALLATHPTVSVCALRWVGFMLADSSFTNKAAFLSVLPVFLQIAVEAGQHHPLQRADCCEVFTTVVVLSPTGDEDELSGIKASVDAYTIVTGQKDALECLVHLMGCGYLAQPMAFLARHHQELDAVLVRHLLRTLIQVRPPFSAAFATQLVELMSTETSRKAFLSAHFLRKDAVALSALSKELTASLKGEGEGEESSRRIGRFVAVVQECAAVHRLSIQ